MLGGLREETKFEEKNSPVLQHNGKMFCCKRKNLFEDIKNSTISSLLRTTLMGAVMGDGRDERDDERR
jgi:hypothetical protein